MNERIVRRSSSNNACQFVTNGENSLYDESERRCCMPLHLRLLWKRATQAGFTPESLYYLLMICNLEPKLLTVEDVRQVLPFVNRINALKFGGAVCPSTKKDASNSTKSLWPSDP